MTHRDDALQLLYSDALSLDPVVIRHRVQAGFV